MFRLAPMLAIALPALSQAAPEVTADALPRVPPTGPAEALSTFTLTPGFELQLAAAEPLVVDPIAIAFDEHGHLFAVEMRGYSERRHEALGRIRRLTDSDGDGTYDQATVYADGLKWPTGIACYDGGVFVAASPDILYFKDTDGDGAAEVSEVVFTGFGQQRLNVQALLNGFRWSLDNRLVGATAANGGTIPLPEAPPLNLRGRDFSFDPATRNLRPEPGTAQYGHSFDSFGRRFVCSNSRHIMAVIAAPRGTASSPYSQLPSPLVDIPADGPSAEVFRLSPDEPWRVVRTRWRVAGLVGGPIEGGGRPSGYFTGATGLTVYTGDALGPDLVDNAFIGDAGSNLVHRKRITYPDGEVQPVASRPDSERDHEFIASTDNWFRPVSFANGPDGALYVVDMYREVIEHPWSLPPGIKQHLDLNSGNDRGRIYRVVRSGAPRSKPRPLTGNTTPQLVAALAHPNGWHRTTAQRLLVQRQDPAAVSALSDLLAAAPSPHARLHALWTLHGLRALSPQHIERAQSDPHPELRVAALRLGGTASPDDPSARVRFELAFKSSADIATLATLLERPDRRGWIGAAALHGIRTPEQATRLFNLHPGSTAVASLLGRTADRSAIAAALERPDLTPPVVEAIFDGLGDAGTSLSKLDLHDIALPHFHAALSSLDTTSNIALLRHAPRVLIEAPLTEQLKRTTSAQLQSALINTLAKQRCTSLQTTIASIWKNLAPSTRNSTIPPLLSNLPLQALELVRSGVIARSEIPSTNRSALSRHADPAVKALAAELFPAPETDHAARIAARLSDLDLEPDPGRGATHFATLCASCHQPADDRPPVGPDRLTFRSSGAATILTNLIDPNREVAPQYAAYTVTLKSGETHVGLVSNESPTHLTLRQPLGVEQVFPRAQIASVEALGTSLMPENLDAALTPQALADLIAYLTGS